MQVFWGPEGGGDEMLLLTRNRSSPSTKQVFSSDATVRGLSTTSKFHKLFNLVLWNFQHLCTLPFPWSHMASSPVPPGVDPCSVPAAVPPDGQLPNLVNPTSLATATIVTSVLLTVWALAFVAARVMVNRRKLSWSDCRLKSSRPRMVLKMALTRADFMVIGMIFDIAYTVVAIASK